MTSKANIHIKAHFDPMLQAMADQVHKDPVFRAIAKKFAEEDNVCVTDFRNGAVYAYPADEFLEAYYNHMAAKGR